MSSRRRADIAESAAAHDIRPQADFHQAHDTIQQLFAKTEVKTEVMSIFLLPTLYVWMAGDRDVLPGADGKFEEGEHID
jgi:hypothetical protein